MKGNTARKVTISLPEDLVLYADSLARERKSTRSAVISELLEKRRLRERDDLARRGYRFYAEEAEEFAAASQAAVAEAVDDERSSW